MSCGVLTSGGLVCYISRGLCWPTNNCIVTIVGYTCSCIVIIVGHLVAL